LRKFDAAIIDPPRAGAEAQIDELSASDINLIAYVSCNPTTFARDAAHLVPRGFEIEFVQTVDQFRWSTHIELVAKFSRN
jgi:23S rRNA (uracil1939-C5)-methyltransferase